MPTLDWIGKAAVVNHHRQVGYHLLRCDRELSAGEATEFDWAGIILASRCKPGVKTISQT
jgi:hypothetical protein